MSLMPKKALIFLTALVLTVLLFGTAQLAANPGWDQQNPGVSGSWDWVSCVNPWTVWVSGQTNLITSTDGGVTWESHVPPTNLQLGPISAIDSGTAWVVGWIPSSSSSETQIYKTTDTGQTWTQQFSYPKATIFDVAAVDANNIWAYGYVNNGPSSLPYQTNFTNVIIKSSDGGTTWSPKFSWSYSFIIPIQQSLYPCDANTLWTTGVLNSQSGIWKTVDGGTSWSFVSSSLTLTVIASINIGVRGVDANTAWMTDNDSVFKTTDGGTTWVRQYMFAPPSIYRLPTIAAFGSGVAWIGLSGGRIIRTIDGGVNWSSQTFPGVDQRSVFISAYDPNNAWAASTTDAGGVSNCSIYHTADGGGQPLSLPVTVTGISPASGVNNAKYAVAITGSGFVAGANVWLQSGTTVINGLGVAVTDPTRLTCYFELTNEPLGKYDVIVRNLNGHEGKLASGFSVTDACGQGAGTMVVGFGLIMGLLSLGGSGFLRRRRGRKSR